MFKSIINKFFGEEQKVKPKSLRWETIYCKWEKLIANYFYNNGINYDYNVPIKGGFLNRTIANSSFYLPRYDAYIVYIRNSPGCKYKNKKIIFYLKKYKIPFVVLYIDDLNHLDKILVEKFAKFLWKEFIVEAH